MMAATLAEPKPDMESSSNLRPFLPPNCRIDPGLEAEPVVIRLAELADLYLTRALVFITTRAAVRLPSAPTRVVPPLARPCETLAADDRACHPGTTRAELADLARHEDPAVRVQVACNPKTAAATLVRLAGDSEQTIRALVARHPNLPAPQQALLSRDASPFVQMGLARNPKVDLPILLRLSESEREEVRQSVAANCGAPPDLLERLADDPAALVRGAVASNRQTPAARLARLAKDGDQNVRACVTRNTPASRADFVPLPTDEPPVLLTYSLFEGGIEAYVEADTSTVWFLPDRLATVEQAEDLALWVKFGHGEA